MEFGWRHDETFVNGDLSAFGMVHRHESDEVVVINFPQLCGDANVVITVVRDELVATDLVPLAGRGNLRGTERVDAQTDRRSPRHCVFNKFHVLAVVRKEPRTRSFQTLLGQHFLIGFDFKLRAHCSIGPNDANHVGARLLAETKVKQWTRDRLFLDQQAGANLHLAADAEWIDALIADGIARAWADNLPVIILRALVDRFEWFAVSGKTEEIQSPVVVDIRDVESLPWSNGVR